MSIFGRGKGGGFMNVIRCDEEKYLVWKWRPAGQEVNSTSREHFSLSSTKPNSVVDQSTISSQARERCIWIKERLAAVSR